MRRQLILTLSLCLVVSGCSAQLRPGLRRVGYRRQVEQHKCDIQRLIASEPSNSLKTEGGIIEIWDDNATEFRCTGFVALRGIIHPGGLLIPSYTSAPYLTFIAQGSGVQSMILQGCPETFRSGRDERDQYQKVFRIRKGDVMAAPSGVVQWTYNDGDTDLIRVTLVHTYSFHNQLDNDRSFFLAGGREGAVASGSNRQISWESGEHWAGGILSGFDDEILTEIFRGIEPDTIPKLRGFNDKRGTIVDAADLNIHVPEEDEESRTGNGGGVDDCSLKFTHNIDSPAHADVFNRDAGRINTVNSKSLPILQRLGLSAQHVVLYKNAIIGPRWNQNAHSTVYVIKGGGRAQVVGDEGKAVFDDVLHRGQMMVIPQGFVVVIKAGPEGVEWVEMKTNDNPISSPIAGGTSVLRAIPVEVLASAFDVSTEEALKIKYARREIDLFPVV